MLVAAAQTKPVKKDIAANIAKHLHLIAQAAAQNVELIVFPEMSLTGYEREAAADLAFSENDERMNVFKKASVTHGMIIIAGAPIRIKDALYIGAFICLPDGTMSIYTKQFLHDGEEDFFVPGKAHNPLIVHHGLRISMAICADIAHPEHAAHAAQQETNLYVAGIFYTPSGIDVGHEILGNYAKEYDMQVLMANYGGPSYTFEAGGLSAFWNSCGQLIAQLGKDEEGLLIAATRE